MMVARRTVLSGILGLVSAALAKARGAPAAAGGVFHRSFGPKPASEAPLVVYRFFTRVQPWISNPERRVASDWVEYGPAGKRETSVVIDKVSRILAVRSLSEIDAQFKNKKHRSPGDYEGALIAHRVATWRADIIGPQYEAWKAGNWSADAST